MHLSTRCKTCREELGEGLYCPSCGMPVPSAFGGRLNLHNALLLGAAIAFILMGISPLPWFGPRRNWLMTVAVVALAALAIALLIGHWRKRLPLRAKGSEIQHSERPLAYHLCTLAAILFAFMLLIAGCLAALNDLKAAVLSNASLGAEAQIQAAASPDIVFISNVSRH